MDKKITGGNKGSNKGAGKEVIKSADALAMVAGQKPLEKKQPEVKQPEVKQPEVKLDQTGGTETIQAAPQAAAPAAAVVVSKASKANAVFARMFAEPQVPARKAMIDAAIAEAGLTPAGAATYLQNYKSKHGLVNRQAATA